MSGRTGRTCWSFAAGFGVEAIPVSVIGVPCRACPCDRIERELVHDVGQRHGLELRGFREDRPVRGQICPSPGQSKSTVTLPSLALSFTVDELYEAAGLASL